MTRILLVLLLPVLIAACNGKGGSASVQMKTLGDSAGYALGVNLAGNLKQQKMAGMNFGLTLHAMEEVMEGKTTQFPIEAAGMVLQQYAMISQTGMGDTTNRGSLEAKIENDVPQLTSLADSAGYAMGLNLGTTLKMNKMADLNRDLMKKAIGQILNNDSVSLKPDDCIDILNRYMAKKQEDVVAAQQKEGAEFLEKNGQRPEVKTTASGLQYEVIKEGTGPKPGINDIFVVNYKGMLLDGTEFGSSEKHGQPLEYGVNEVVAGWIEGLQLMSKGSKYKFYIKSDLAYGNQGNPPTIPGGATLVFEIELLDIKKR